MKALFERHGLQIWALGNHLVSHAVCDHPIDRRHQAILPAHVWGDGDPEGVRRRAADEVKDSARAAARLGGTTGVGLPRSWVSAARASGTPCPAPRRYPRTWSTRASTTSPSAGRRSSTSS